MKIKFRNVVYTVSLRSSKWAVSNQPHITTFGPIKVNKRLA